MIDLNAIKHRHLDPERMKGRTYYAGHIERGEHCRQENP